MKIVVRQTSVGGLLIPISMLNIDCVGNFPECQTTEAHLECSFSLISLRHVLQCEDFLRQLLGHGLLSIEPRVEPKDGAF